MSNSLDVTLIFERVPTTLSSQVCDIIAVRSIWRAVKWAASAIDMLIPQAPRHELALAFICCQDKRNKGHIVHTIAAHDNFGSSSVSRQKCHHAYRQLFFCWEDGGITALRWWHSCPVRFRTNHQTFFRRPLLLARTTWEIETLAALHPRSQITRYASRATIEINY
jgi:hypothetical protein